LHAKRKIARNGIPKRKLLYFRKSVTESQSNIQVLWGWKLIKFLGPSLRKRIQNYEYKSRHAREYLFRIRKEMATKRTFKKADKYHRHHKIQKIRQYFY